VAASSRFLPDGGRELLDLRFQVLDFDLLRLDHFDQPGPPARLVNRARSANDSASAHPTRARCAGNISSITLMIRSAMVIAS